MKAWRRSARTVPDAPTLLLASLVVATRILSLTFNRSVVVSGSMGFTNLVPFSGSNRYENGTNGVTSGFVVTFNYPAPTPDITAPKLTHLTTTLTIRDTRGNKWADGDYAITIV